MQITMFSKNLLFFTLFTTCHAIGRHIYTSSVKPPQNEIDMGGSGDPLLLTPFIDRGQLSYARNLSRVGKALSSELTSYSGYLTVNPKYQSNMFFWYFPATVSTVTYSLRILFFSIPLAEILDLNSKIFKTSFLRDCNEGLVS